MSEIDLTAIQELIVAEKRADQARIAAEKEAAGYKRVRDQIRNQLDRVMGANEVGLVGNQEVLRKTLSEQFAHARFREENPDLWDLVKVVETKETVDVDKLKQISESTYEKYCTTRWTNTIEVA